jgi:glycosyltransferase involved in cell wall biosynthesis
LQNYYPNHKLYAQGVSKEKIMNILILEPYFTGSHAAWAEGYVKHSQHNVEILSMRGHFWKWRMHGGAATLAREFLVSDFAPDLLLATDILDLTTFLALTRTETADIPTAIYFHENQLSYPWSSEDRDVLQKRDKHYGFINYVSALAADVVFFNSQYHLDSFLTELSRLLKHFPDYNELESVEQIKNKSSVLPLGLDLKRFDRYNPRQQKSKIANSESVLSKVEGSKIETPLILWNHRWEYDKNPGDFFQALQILAKRGLDFKVAILGERFRQQPTEFVKAQAELGARVVHCGYVEDFATYAGWLWQADLLPVTSNQDFFGVSVMQALYCHCYPLLPRRLAYPELIPPKFHADHFYSDFNDLVERLETALRDVETIRQQSLRTVAARYDWTNIAPEYDAKFQKVGNFELPSPNRQNCVRI